MRRWFIHLSDQDLAYLPEGSEHFDDYVEGVTWAQEYARVNRELMMKAVIGALAASGKLPEFDSTLEVVNCHRAVSMAQVTGATVGSKELTFSPGR